MFLFFIWEVDNLWRVRNYGGIHIKKGPISKIRKITTWLHCTWLAPNTQDWNKTKKNKGVKNILLPAQAAQEARKALAAAAAQAAAQTTSAAQAVQNK